MVRKANHERGAHNRPDSSLALDQPQTEAMVRAGLNSRRRQHPRATHGTRTSILSVQEVHGHNRVTWDRKEDTNSSLNTDEAVRGTYEIIQRPPRRHLPAVGEYLRTLESRTRYVYHAT
jgi:hypothetical protein